MSVGILALLVFIVIGIGHRDRVGERYESHAAVVEEVQAEESAEEIAEEIVHIAEEIVHIEEEAAQADEQSGDEEAHEEQPADATHQ